MSGISRRTVVLALAPLLAPLWSGCAGRDGAVAFETTRAGSIMTELRTRHGGVRRFREFSGVVFSYRVQFRGQVRRFESVGLRFSEPGRVWIRPTPEGSALLLGLEDESAPLRARPVSALATVAATPEGFVGLTDSPALVDAEGPVKREVFREPELDLALRSISFLLEPGLTTSVGGCRYRTLVAPGHADPRRIEVEPASASSFDVTYLLEEDPRTGLLSHALYRGSHPVIRGRTQIVAFDDYASIQGILVARRRVHRRPIDVKARRLERNPFADPPATGVETFLTEHLDAIRFLTPAEADELLPLPRDDAVVTSRESPRGPATEDGR